MAERDILTEIRETLAALPTARDQALSFIAHDTNTPFAQSASGEDRFHVQHGGTAQQAEAFGVAGSKVMDWRVEVLLGVAPYATDAEREGALAEDISNIQDALEFRVWTSGSRVQAVWPLGDEVSVDRTDATFWIVTIPFRVNYLRTINA